MGTQSQLKTTEEQKTIKCISALDLAVKDIKFPAPHSPFRKDTGGKKRGEKNGASAQLRSDIPMRTF